MNVSVSSAVYFILILVIVRESHLYDYPYSLIIMACTENYDIIIIGSH